MHADLVQFLADRVLVVVFARMHHVLIRQPVRRNDGHVGGDDLDLGGRRDHLGVGHEQFAHVAREAHLVADDLLEMRLERAVAGEQVVEVAIQEPVGPHEIGHVLQIRPGFVDRWTMIFGKAQPPFDLLLELREDAVDDVVLVAEMVVQVAWTDFHFLGDRRGRDVRLADLVEEFQRQLENPFAGAAGRFRFHVVRPVCAGLAGAAIDAA